MAFPNHLRLVWGGTFFTSEIWSMGITLDDTGFATDQARTVFCTDNLEACATAVSTWWASTSSGGSSAAKLTWCKLNAVGEDGKYISQESEIWNYVSPVNAGAFASAVHPWAPAQIALVISLLSDKRAGRGSHGRVFLPCAQFNTDGGVASPFLTSGTPTTIAAGFKDLVNDINAIGGGGPDVCIVSKSKDGPFVPAMTTKVTRVRVGNAFDTMQSRRNRLRETYAEETL